MVLVEVSNGRGLLQLIYQGGRHLVDCDEVTGPSLELDNFLADFDATPTNTSCPLASSDNNENNRRVTDCYRQESVTDRSPSETNSNFKGGDKFTAWYDGAKETESEKRTRGKGESDLVDAIPEIKPWLDYKSLSRRCSSLHKLYLEKATNSTLQEHRQDIKTDS